MSDFTLSLFEDRLARIRRDCEVIESDVTVLHELRRLNPCMTPLLDVRRSAQSLRLAAQKLDEMAAKAELVE